MVITKYQKKSVWPSNMVYLLSPQEHRESKKRLEEIVDELKKELSAAEHQLQKNTMEIKVLAYLYMYSATK